MNKKPKICHTCCFDSASSWLARNVRNFPGFLAYDGWKSESWKNPELLHPDGHGNMGNLTQRAEKMIIM